MHFMTPTLVLQMHEMEEDPLNASGNVRARTANEFLKAFRRVFEHEHELHLPIYAHHGSMDRLANLTVSKVPLAIRVACVMLVAAARSPVLLTPSCTF